jgi:hypothetical protein
MSRRIESDLIPPPRRQPALTAAQPSISTRSSTPRRTRPLHLSFLLVSSVLCSRCCSEIALRSPPESFSPTSHQRRIHRQWPRLPRLVVRPRSRQACAGPRRWLPLQCPMSRPTRPQYTRIDLSHIPTRTCIGLTAATGIIMCITTITENGRRMARRQQEVAWTCT